MGYKVVRTVYRLVFEDRSGMEVRARGADVDGFLELTGLTGMAKAEADTPPAEDSAKAAEVTESIRTLLDRFSKILIDWNLEEEDGTPIPATLAGLGSLELDFLMEIISAWITTVSDVPGPLVNSSTPGAMQEVAASLQMESLPSSPLSSLVPS